MTAVASVDHADTGTPRRSTVGQRRLGYALLAVPLFHVSGCYAVFLTALRAGIIVGSGSASFEIIRDLVEKLPVMVTPRWLNTEHQPIAVDDVLRFIAGVLGNPATYGGAMLSR